MRSFLTNSRAAGRQLAAMVIWLGCCLAAAPCAGVEMTRLPFGFVYLRDLDPTIVQDIRYAGAENFTRARVIGYKAGECILLREAAEALKLVQDDLRQRGLSLKVYDCYRPVRAVRAFMQWVRNPSTSGDPRYWPRTERGDLVRLGYIAAKSIHSTGAAVDLTLITLPLARAPSSSPSLPDAACNAAGTDREPDSSLDMGTSFDCFDEMSYTASKEITAEERENRRLLVDAMAARKFKNYFREWWHFTYVGLPNLPKAQDFVISK
jgi:zinc D-Ala-D-Ala dipeptidase